MSWCFWVLFVCSFPLYCAGYDVMMVIGGMSTKHSSSPHYKSVEVIDVDGVCSAPALPHPLFGAGAGKLRDQVTVCGGYDGKYERQDCWNYDSRSRLWRRLGPLPHRRGLLFPGTATDGKSNLYLVGGRSYNHSTFTWDYLTDVWRLHAPSLRWTKLPSLPNATAEGCLLHFNGDLIFIGGTKAKFRYADDPSKVWVLQSRNNLERGETWRWRDDLIPPLIGPRTWQGCVLTNVDDQAGILVAGGYHTGRLSMFYAFDENYPRRGIFPGKHGKPWETVGWLPAQRQWGPAFGLVAGVPTIASGMNYGDETIDEFVGWNDWRRSWKQLRYKREFSSCVNVPNHWFNC